MLAEKLLKKHKKALIGIAEKLYEEEVLEREEFENLLRKYGIRVRKEEDELARFKVFGKKFDFRKKEVAQKKAVAIRSKQGAKKIIKETKKS